MFDLSIPLMTDQNSGASVICMGNYSEVATIHKEDCVRIDDFVKFWHMEASAIARGARKRGILPTSIVRDGKGRFGCNAGWILIRQGDRVHVYDCSRGFLGDYETCERQPSDWWRCIRHRSGKGDKGLRTVPVSSIRDWSERLELFLNATEVMSENAKWYREVRERNSAILADVLGSVDGGMELLSAFPADYMERFRYVIKDTSSHSIGIGKEAGSDSFDGLEVMPSRSVDELVWWINNVLYFDGGNVVFLMPRRDGTKGVRVMMLRPNDDIENAFPKILAETHLEGKAVDYVVFGTKCDLPKSAHCGNPAVLAKKAFLRLLNGVGHVLIGVKNGSAWVEFSSDERPTFPPRPLFEGRVPSVPRSQLPLTAREAEAEAAKNGWKLALV